MPVKKNCIVCGAAYYRKPSAAAKSFYCSYPCMASAYRNRMTGANNPNYKDAARKTCWRCKCEYFSYQASRFCSKQCAAKSRHRKMEQVSIRFPARPKPPKRVKKVHHCAACGVVVKAHAKRCADCRGSYRRKNCITCGVAFENRGCRKTCASETCTRLARANHQRGPKSHRWQGGKTTAAMVLRNSVEYAIWRTAVFRRDDFVCQICNQRGGKLTAHHIREFAKHPELRLNVTNGVSLCWECHRSIRGKEPQFVDQFTAIISKRAA